MPDKKRVGLQSNIGRRLDGSLKGPGFLGSLTRPDGGVSTELSIGVQFGGRELEIPSLVPSLTKKEINSLLTLKEGQKMGKGIVKKARDHAESRMQRGLSPFLEVRYAR